MRIITEFEYPPIPIRTFDWCAMTDDYEPGDPLGYGATEEEAIADLQRQLDEAVSSLDDVINNSSDMKGE